MFGWLFVCLFDGLVGVISYVVGVVVVGCVCC